MTQNAQLVVVLDAARVARMVSSSWGALGIEPLDLLGARAETLWGEGEWPEAEALLDGTAGQHAAVRRRARLGVGGGQWAEWTLLTGAAGTAVALGQLVEASPSRAPSAPVPVCVCVVESSGTVVAVMHDGSSDAPSTDVGARVSQWLEGALPSSFSEAFARATASIEPVQLDLSADADPAPSQLIGMVAGGGARWGVVLFQRSLRLDICETDSVVDPSPSEPFTSIEVGSMSGNLLVVDDDPLVRHALTRYLQRVGYRVLTARDGDDALDVLGKHPEVDAVLTDIRMPRRDGSSLAEEVLGSHPRLPLLAVTGYSDDSSRARLQELGVPVLDKPVSPARIVRILERLRASRERRPE